MRRYNMIKNILLGSLIATMYYGYVLENIPALAKVIGTAAVFVAVVMLMCNADKEYLRKRKSA